MNKLWIRLLLVIAILAGAVSLIVREPVKLGLDLKGGVYAVLEASPEKEGDVIDNETMNSLIEVLDRRINGIGVAESVVQKAGNNRVIIELPGISDTTEAINMIGKTALLEFKIMDENGNLGPTLLTGGALKKAQVGYGNLGEPQINFEMKPEGAIEFARITRENVGKQLAIVLDGKVQTAPVIRTEIPGGTGSISGNYTVEEAKRTATLLNSGALPIKAEIVETRTVGASLGDESIAASMVAGKVAMALIGIFMLVFYRFPGIVADIALVCFGIITFALLQFIGATLTLPGIAGLILSAGMAVDANVIIFERIKEELGFGNTIRGAINAGFSKGFVAIFDSNLTTLIITGILFIFGTGPVKGFAVTLTIGTVASMFTAIVMTKVLLMVFVEVFHINNPKLFGIRGKA
ncbi:protein translocase subunit SecD [Fusobacterium perfoetens]|uniref:protein translocase subunit SecD n=1 Tax=Fusobacterium perfoetens TaxID=852 RepID=UPI0015A1B64B|nr:protein translocase subunit SecD [Fusobacterium perfoetens]MCF2626057.1 protein translocase subunit SecD [Fusobacterium perfoetens]